MQYYILFKEIFLRTGLLKKHLEANFAEHLMYKNKISLNPQTPVLLCGFLL